MSRKPRVAMYAENCIHLPNTALIVQSPMNYSVPKLFSSTRASVFPATGPVCDDATPDEPHEGGYQQEHREDDCYDDAACLALATLPHGEARPAPGCDRSAL